MKGTDVAVIIQSVFAGANTALLGVIVYMLKDLRTRVNGLEKREWERLERGYMDRWRPHDHRKGNSYNS